MRPILLRLSDFAERSERHHLLRITLNDHLGGRTDKVDPALFEVLLLGSHGNCAPTTGANDNAWAGKTFKRGLRAALFKSSTNNAEFLNRRVVEQRVAC